MHHNSEHSVTFQHASPDELDPHEAGGKVATSSAEEWWEVLASLKKEAAALRAAQGVTEALRQNELDLWNE